MDLQKERELFLAHMRSIGSSRFMFELDEDGNFDDMSMAYAWSAWQAAKAQAVSEGHLVVPKHYIENAVYWGDAIKDSMDVGSDLVLQDMKAMIESQEPTND